MNTIKMTLLAVALTVAGLASAALDPLTYVVELEYSSSPVPAHEADRMTIKRCLKHIGVYEESLEIAAPKRNQRLADPVSETWLRLYGEEKAKRDAAS